jgi:hypothetical protein
MPAAGATRSRKNDAATGAAKKAAPGKKPQNKIKE